MPSSQAPLPAGSRGLPGIGETLTFLRDGFGFVEKRVRKHGTIFRTHLLGKDAVVIAGPDASHVWIDPSRVERTGAMPSNIQEIFGGRSLPLLDGTEHRGRKEQVLAGFTHSAIESYLPGMQSVMNATFDRWSKESRPISGISELKRLSIDVIGANVLGLEPGPRLDALRDAYGVLTLGMGALPLPMPQSTYRRALAARDQILATLREEVVRERKNRPSESGLSRMLQAQASDGSRLDDEAAVLELHHVVVAGYIVFAELAQGIVQLAIHEETLSRVRAEIQSVAPKGPLGPSELRRLPFTSQVVKELKRLTPILPVVFGKAKTDFEFAGRRVPRGWMLLWAPYSSMLWPGSFSEPSRFDPDRFSPARAEGIDEEHVFVPQGPGKTFGHKCPGTDYATVIMQMFFALLARDFSWEIPDQDLSVAWNRIPPEPRDGLRMNVRRVDRHATEPLSSAGASRR